MITGKVNFVLRNLKLVSTVFQLLTLMLSNFLNRIEVLVHLKDDRVFSILFESTEYCQLKEQFSNEII